LKRRHSLPRQAQTRDNAPLCRIAGESSGTSIAVESLGTSIGQYDARCAGFTGIQRFGDGLRLNPHFHTISVDGVYVAEAGSERPSFVALPPPNQQEVEALLARAHRAILRRLQRLGLIAEIIDREPNLFDPIAEAEPVLAHCAAASLLDCVAVGERAGELVLRLVETPGTYRGGQADAERIHRELHRPLPRRVPERELVREPAGRHRDDRGMASGLQRSPTEQCARQQHASGVQPGANAPQKTNQTEPAERSSSRPTQQLASPSA
jgi:hypothetical protein